jgi:hypothetical protein
MKSIRHDDAVSPVVGVMLMLVVCIIIAAVVSGFAGIFADTTEKTPQATIQADFSVADGMTIYHAGGDAIATQKVTLILRHSDMFGLDVASRGASVLNKSLIQDADEKYWVVPGTGQVDVPAFTPGDSAYITEANCGPLTLQPEVAPTKDDGTLAPKTVPNGAALWPLCFKNSDNVGKVFYLEVLDENGNFISKCPVTIEP